MAVFPIFEVIFGVDIVAAMRTEKIPFVNETDRQEAISERVNRKFQ
jgi:hypothetical protein